MAAILGGVRVLDLTHHVAGPYCTKLLADFGADVVKIERPGRGDPTRDMAPFQGDDPHPEKSLLFLHLNTNKRSVTLDLKTSQGRTVLRRLAAGADVVVESFNPGAMARFGLAYEELAEVNPVAVMTSISNFGQTGPYRDMKGTDLTLYAMGGAMNVTGSADREPLRVAGHVVQCQAGAVAAYATLLALMAAEDGGEGQHVDVSIYETQAGSRDRRVIHLTAFQYTGETGKRSAGSSVRLGAGVRPCADGYVNVFGGLARFPLLCRLIGREDLLLDPRLATEEARSRGEGTEEFENAYLEWLMERPKRRVVAEAQAVRILAAPIYTTEDLLQDPHFQARGAWEDISHPFAGVGQYPGRPFVMSGTPRPHARRAPLLGEHTEEVLCGDPGYSAEDVARMRREGVV